MERIDLVYPLGSQSLHQNIELQYSLASVERYLKGYRNIYIVGDHPGFDGNFIHIPAADDGKNRQDNIRKKIELACQLPELSERFLFMNDDFFLLQECDVDMPYYYDSNLAIAHKGKRKPGHYKQAIYNTLITLAEADLPLRYYDVHTPIIYDKALFPQVMSRYNWGIRDGYVIKSLYANTLKIEGERLPDCKLNHCYETEIELNSFLENRFMFSVGDNAFGDILLNFLAKRYCL